MKKVLALLLALVMAFSMVACSQEAGSQGTNDTPGSTPADTAGTPDTPDTSTPGGAANVNSSDFDAYPRPVVRDTLTVGYMIRTPDAESHIRSLQQAEIEAAHRGWTLIPSIYEDDTNFRDYFLNLLNQGVDAIIVGSVDTYETKQELVDMARSQGIGMYSNDTQVIPGVISNCTMPNGTAAMEMFFKIGEDYGWDLDVCAMTMQSIQSDRMRMYPMIASLDGIWPNMTLLAKEDYGSSSLPSAQAAYEFVQTWIQQYGDGVQCFLTGADYWGIPAAEAIIQAGDPHGEKWFSVGFDGGSQAWTYIRDETPLLYSYAQPFEAFTHNVFEIIDQIQVQGLNPGDPGCLISQAGETVYNTGAVVTRANVPAIGSNIHEFFNYYDPNDTNAWYTWTDGPGIYTVEEYIA